MNGDDLAIHLGKALHKLTTGMYGVNPCCIHSFLYMDLFSKLRFTVFIHIVPAAVSYEKLCNTKFNNIILTSQIIYHHGASLSEQWMHC